MPLWVATAIPRVQIGTVSIGANVIQVLPMSFRKSAHAAEVIILITVTVSPFVGLITDTPIVPRMQDDLETDEKIDRVGDFVSEALNSTEESGGAGFSSCRCVVCHSDTLLFWYL